MATLLHWDTHSTQTKIYSSMDSLFIMNGNIVMDIQLTKSQMADVKEK